VWRSFAFEVGEKKSLGKVEEIWKKSLGKVEEI